MEPLPGTLTEGIEYGEISIKVGNGLKEHLGAGRETRDEQQQEVTSTPRPEGQREQVVLPESTARDTRQELVSQSWRLLCGS